MSSPVEGSPPVDLEAEDLPSEASPLQTPQMTSAQLSLARLLQGTTHTVGSTQPRSALIPNTQARDAKPRLLLMGLRRYVFYLHSLTGKRKLTNLKGVASPQLRA